MTGTGAAEPWRERYAHPCGWDQSFPPLSLPAMFVEAAEAVPDQPVVEFYGRWFSYTTMLAEARAFAAALQRAGFVKGERIGLFLPNVPLYVAAYYGALIAGCTVVNFSPLYTPVELEAQVADSGARVIVTLDVPALLPTAVTVLKNSALERLVVCSLADQLPLPKGLALRLFGRKGLTPVPNAPDVCSWSEFLGARVAPAAVEIDPLTDLAMLQYTGGTTGAPKGAMLTHQNVSANARQIEAVDPHKHERDVIMGVLPLFHVFANACVLNRTVFDRGCVSMLPRFDAGQTLKAIRRVKATAMPGVPTMYQALLDHPDLAKSDLSSLRVCISGGAPLPAPTKQRFEAETGAKLIEGYGLTECSGVASTNPYEGDEHPGTIGQPLPATRMALLDKDDPTRFAARGEPGELLIDGPQIMQGYWNRPAEAASAFAELGDRRWLRTGDIAVIECDGFVRIVDRSKDMIAVGGFKVFPSEVEAALLHNPAVKEALVIGVPDAYHGEVPRAFVTLSGAAEPEALREWLNARVGKHERVDRVVVRDALPKTMIGKLDRKALRAEVAAEAAANC